jgi:hypothetical protein
MMNLSFWAHIAALAGYMGLVYWVVELRQQRQNLSILLGYPPRVTIDWPLRFLRHLSAALGVQFHMYGSDKSGDPVRINVGKVSEFFRSIKVNAISRMPGDGIITLEFCVEGKPQSQMAEDLQDAFQNAIKVKIREKG